MTHPADEAAALMTAIDAKHVAQNAAERILDEFGDWQGLGLEDPRSDKFNENALRCCSCWHSTPKHYDDCIAWRLALALAEARAESRRLL